MNFLITSIICLVIFLGYIVFTDKIKKINFLKNFMKPKKQFLESDNIDEPINFGYKNLWFAVRTDSKEDLANLLDIKILGKANWQNGVEQAYDYRIFITPLVNSWTLICGNGLLTLLDKDSSDIQILNKLSKNYREAQYFYTHRITDYHIWAKSENGELKRYYSYIGEQGENIKIEGQPTDIEKGFKLIDTHSDEAKNDNYLDNEELVFPDESLVMDIAQNWSVNPTILETYKDIKKEFGLVCEAR